MHDRTVGGILVGGAQCELMEVCLADEDRSRFPKSADDRRVASRDVSITHSGCCRCGCVAKIDQVLEGNRNAMQRSAVVSGRNLPVGLLVLTLVVVMIALPLDLAGIEPFAAYIVRSAGWATITVAIVGLVASFFVPQAYCRFGCPTGALLNFVRARGPTDRFSRRDVAALVLVVIAVTINWNYLSVITWVKGVG